MDKAKKLISFIEQDYTGPYDNPPSKKIPPNRGTEIEAVVKKFFKDKGIEASIVLRFISRSSKKPGEYKPSDSFIEIHLKDMTVDDFNKRNDLPEFNSLISSYHTDWGIVRDTILVGYNK